MKKINKKILKIFLLIYSLLAIVPVYARDYSVLGPGTGLGLWAKRHQMEGGANCKSGQKCFGGSSVNGAYIYLVKYHYGIDKKERLVGTPVLYYNSGFLSEASGNPGPASKAGITGVNAGLTTYSSSGGGSFSTEHAPQILEGIHKNPNKLTDLVQGYVVHDANVQSGARCIINPLTMTYGNEVINTYPTDLIRYTIMGKKFSESEITKYQVSSDLSASAIRSYVNNSVLPSMFSTKSNPIDAVNAYFKINGADRVTEKNIEDYYIAIEIAYRDLTGDSPRSSTSSSSGGSEVKESPITWNYKCTCNAGYTGGGTVSVKEGGTPQTKNACSKTVYEPCNCRNSDNESCDYWESGCSCDDCPDTVYANSSCTYSSCTGYRVTIVNELTTVENFYWSDVVNGRESNNYSAKNDLSTLTTDDAEHKLMKSGTTGEYFTEYYIGPSLDTALVGMESTQTDTHSQEDKNTFLYNFADRSTKNPRLKNNGKYSATGVLYKWLPEAILKYRSCVNEANPSVAPCRIGDLKCAENFCDNLIGYDDRANSYQMKKDCIELRCKYNKKEDNCSSTEHNKEYLDNLNNACATNNMSTYCSRISETSKNSGEEAKKDKPTTQWCYNDEETTPIDQRTFINISCTENSYFTFADISKVRLTSGIGIDYWTRLNGNKKCKIWFDLDSWQLAYASFHSRDKVCIDYDMNTKRCLREGKSSREYLEEILNRYNKASVSYDPIVEYNFKDPLMNTISTVIDSSEHATDIISWEQLNYTVDDARVQIKTKVTETVNNETISSKEYSLVSVEEPAVETLVTYNEKDKQTGYYKYNRLNASAVYANSYISSSNVTREYAFDKHCLSTDGKSTVSLSGGTCYKVQSNGINSDVKGSNTYYTTLRPINNTDLYQVSMNTTAVLGDDKNMPAGISAGTSKICKTEEKDDCDSNTGASCFITIEKNVGTVLDSKIYTGANGVNAVLNIMNNNETIQGYNIEARKSEANVSLGGSDVDRITVVPSASAGLEEIEISGIVKTNKGTVTCSKKIKADKCNSACTFTKIEDDKQGNIRYEVNIGPGGKIYTQNSKSTNKLEVSKNQAGKYIVGIKQSLIGEDGVKIYATNGNVCCSTKVVSNPCTNPEGCPDDGYNCEEDINGDGTASRQEIKQYCDVYWSVDENDYESSINCIDSCWYKCPIIKKCDSTARKKVEEFCAGKFGSDTTLYSQCVNRCYSTKNCSDPTPNPGEITISEDDDPPHLDDPKAYVFRSISNIDPFPNSDQSPYNQGKRIVGANWNGFEHYITDDKKDQTSVTGPSANQNPEYVIDLTPEDIRNIRDNTKTLMKQKKLDGYTDYEYTEAVKKQKESGVDVVKEYESAFVHDNFRDIFTVAPNKGSDIGE